MNSALFSLAMTALLAAPASPNPWHTDYFKAREFGQKAQKPLFVVVGVGQPGWSGAVRGEVEHSAVQMLENRFVLVFVDRETDSGKKLAGDLGLTAGHGVVVSDKTGELQAFRHAGTLDANTFCRAVERYGDRDFVVKTTEGEPSVIPPPTPAVPVFTPANLNSCLT